MYSQFKTDKQRENEGVWLNYGSFMVRVARAGGANKNFTKKMDVLTRPVRRAINQGLLDDEQADELLRQGYAEDIVLDWKVRQDDGSYLQGIESPDGTLLPFSTENVMETLKALPELFSDIREQAGNMTLFREALREEASGN
jgi:hypothetical protein